MRQPCVSMGKRGSRQTRRTFRPQACLPVFHTHKTLGKREAPSLLCSIFACPYPPCLLLYLTERGHLPVSWAVGGRLEGTSILFGVCTFLSDRQCLFLFFLQLGAREEKKRGRTGRQWHLHSLHYPEEETHAGAFALFAHTHKKHAPMLPRQTSPSLSLINFNSYSGGRVGLLCMCSP